MNVHQIDKLNKLNKLKRLVWNFLWFILTFWIPRRFLCSWKRFIINFFGGKVSTHAVIYSGAKIFQPFNLIMEEYSCLANNVNCYNIDKVFLGKYATVSQNSYLCTGTHDISSLEYIPMAGPIIIEDYVWITANSIILPGVTIGRGAIVGAGAVCRESIPPYAVVIGNPAKIVSFRFTPNEIVEIEKKLYPENKRIPLEELENNYNKYYKKRIKNILNFLN